MNNVSCTEAPWRSGPAPVCSSRACTCRRQSAWRKSYVQIRPVRTVSSSPSTGNSFLEREADEPTSGRSRLGGEPTPRAARGSRFARIAVDTKVSGVRVRVACGIRSDTCRSRDRDPFSCGGPRQPSERGAHVTAASNPKQTSVLLCAARVAIVQTLGLARGRDLKPPAAPD